MRKPADTLAIWDPPSGNPYACIDPEEEERLEAAARKRVVVQLSLGLELSESKQSVQNAPAPHSQAAKLGQRGERPKIAEPAPAYRSGNPYAYASKEADNSVEPGTDIADLLGAMATGLSQAAFRRLCMAIFRPYSPNPQRGTLRPHHRDFIVRNESRSPSIRRKLVDALDKYTLGPELVPYFNREGDGFTEAKLRGIEEAILRASDE